MPKYRVTVKVQTPPQQEMKYIETHLLVSASSKEAAENTIQKEYKLVVEATEVKEQ